MSIGPGAELFTNRKNGIRLIQDIQAQLSDKATVARIAKDVKDFFDQTSIEDILAGVTARSAENPQIVAAWQAIEPLLHTAQAASEREISTFLSSLVTAAPADVLYDSFSQQITASSFDGAQDLTEIYVALATDLPGFVKQNLDMLQQGSIKPPKPDPIKKPKGFHL